MRRKILILSMLLLALPARVLANATPEDLVRNTADVILAEIKKNRELYAKDYARLYKMADEKVLPHFDFFRMSQWVLGRNWRDAGSEQRERFVAAFRDLLVRTYSTALLNYKDQEIVYLPSPRKPGDDDVVVKTEVKQTGGQPSIPIHYSFYKNKDGVWKVYDVTIEGVSLVTNYRSVYATKIREKGMDALIAEIVDNNKKALAGKK
jgi:phospholipid transport system substrate-binding protein